MHETTVRANNQTLKIQAPVYQSIYQTVNAYAFLPIHSLQMR